MYLAHSIFDYLAIAFFFAAVFLVHYRLRSKASLTFIISYVLLATYLVLDGWALNTYIDHAISSGTATDENDALKTYGMVADSIASILLITFGTSFLLSARSIPCVTMQSR